MEPLPRKKKEPITGVSRDPDNKLIVQKSVPLSALWQSDLTLSEFKILDSYLSRIDSHHPEKRAVRFEKGELEKLLGVKRIRTDELKLRVEHLMKPLILKDGARGFRGLALFEEAVCRSDENGVWQVDLECTQKAMKYFFNIENLGYLRYKLRCVAGLSSRYSYILFVYLEGNRFRKSWEISFDELKHLLACENEPTYQQFYRFNDRLLKRCHKELNEKTECHFSYEPIKKGRSVVAVRFAVETLPELDVEPIDPDQYTFDDLHLKQIDDDRENICCGFGGMDFDGFTLDQLRALKDLSWPKMRQEDVDRHKAVLGDIKLACEYATADYLRQQILRAKTRNPKNLYNYVCKMIENDKGGNT